MKTKYEEHRDKLIDNGYSREQAMNEARKAAFNDTKEQNVQDTKEEQVQDIQNT